MINTYLTNEYLIDTFAYLSASDLSKTSLVCKKWFQIISDRDTAIFEVLKPHIANLLKFSGNKYRTLTITSETKLACFKLVISPLNPLEKSVNIKFLKKTFSIKTDTSIHITSEAKNIIYKTLNQRIALECKLPVSPYFYKKVEQSIQDHSTTQASQSLYRTESPTKKYLMGMR